MTYRYTEPVDPQELTAEAIRKTSEAFRYLFDHNGGRMSYEAQAIEVLLGEIESMKETLSYYRERFDAIAKATQP